MLRSASLGALVFGLTAALAGFVWTAFEFPFAIVVPAFAGWYAVVRPRFGTRKAVFAGLAGGFTFTILFLFGMFLAISDGSPIAITGWLAAVLAAVVAGALTGEVVGGAKAALPIAAFSALGMILATMAAAVLRDVAPAATQIEGVAQYAYFALAQGVIGVLVGAAVGAGVHWVGEHAPVAESTDAGLTPGRPTPA